MNLLTTSNLDGFNRFFFLSIKREFWRTFFDFRTAKQYTRDEWKHPVLEIVTSSMRSSRTI